VLAVTGLQQAMPVPKEGVAHYKPVFVVKQVVSKFIGWISLHPFDSPVVG